MSQLQSQSQVSMQKLWDTYFRKKQQQPQSSTSSFSPTSGQHRHHPTLSHQLSLTTNASSPKLRKANLGSASHQWQSTSQLPLPSSSLETEISPKELKDIEGQRSRNTEEVKTIFTFCKPSQKSLEDAGTTSSSNQLGLPLFSSPPTSDALSSSNKAGFSSPPPSPTRLNFVTGPLPKTISSARGSPPESPIVPKSSSSSPCFLSPTPDSELLGFDPRGLGSNSLELPQNSRSISCDDVRKFKKSSSGSVGGLKGAKATSPVAQYYQLHHERSASMVGDTIGSPSGLEVPATAKSSRSKSFDAASAARAAAASQETQSTSASSGVIGPSGALNQAGKRRVRGSGGFLEIPKWKMLIRRSSAAVGGGSSGSSGGPSGTGAQGAGSTFTIDETTGLYWRDCIHCLLLIEMLKISPPVSCKSSVSSEGSQESEPSSTVIPTSTVSSASTCFTVTGRNRSASCQSALEGVDTNLMALEGSGSCFTDESDEMKMIEATAIKFKSVAEERSGSNVNSGSPSPIPLLTLSFAPDDEFQTEEEDLGNGVTVISLEVPVLPKSGRSASMDNSYLQVPRRPDVHDFELPPGKSIRSRSVDIALPVGSDGPYIIVPSEKPIPATTQ